MTLTEAKAWFGLLAGATPAGTNIGNNVAIGDALGNQAWTDANLAYSIKATSTGASDSFDWQVDTCDAAAVAGSPTLADADGNDFEGIAMSDMATLYACLFVCAAANTGTVTVTDEAPTGSAAMPLTGAMVKDQRVLNVFGAAGTAVAASDDLRFTFTASGDVVEIICIGKTA